MRKTKKIENRIRKKLCNGEYVGGDACWARDILRLAKNINGPEIYPNWMQTEFLAFRFPTNKFLLCQEELKDADDYFCCEEHLPIRVVVGGFWNKLI